MDFICKRQLLYNLVLGTEWHHLGDSSMLSPSSPPVPCIPPLANDRVCAEWRSLIGYEDLDVINPESSEAEHGKTDVQDVRSSAACIVSPPGERMCSLRCLHITCVNARIFRSS